MREEQDRTGAKPADQSRPRSGYYVEALAKGLRLLSMFSEQRPTIRLSEVAAETGMLLPTVYRVAMTLSEEGYLEHLPDGQYRPGVKVLTLGFSALRGLDLVDAARPWLERLADLTQETVNLGILTEDKVLYLIRIRNADLVTANVQVGSTLPATYTSMGKLLLAHLGPQALASRITPASFPGGAGPQAHPSMDTLAVELSEIRSRGYAVQDEELAYGLRSLAGPVRDASGTVIAAVNIAVNARDWTAEGLVSELKAPVLDACEAISRILGHH